MHTQQEIDGEPRVNALVDAVHNLDRIFTDQIVRLSEHFAHRVQQVIGFLLLEQP